MGWLEHVLSLYTPRTYDGGNVLLSRIPPPLAFCPKNALGCPFVDFSWAYINALAKGFVRRPQRTAKRTKTGQYLPWQVMPTLGW